MVVFWQYVWSSISTGSDADPGVALVPGACCHSPCHGVGALPGMMLLCVCGRGEERKVALFPNTSLNCFLLPALLLSGRGPGKLLHKHDVIGKCQKVRIKRQCFCVFSKLLAECFVCMTVTHC